jgi:glycosyltransferase involved in cell wall biosynthesis
MINVGILNPSWTLNRHNTDQKCVLDFSTMGNYLNDISLEFVGSKLHYLQANINFASERLLKYRLINQINISVNDSRIDVLYKYGNEILGLKVDKKNSKPVISTLGFPMLNKDREKGEQYLQNEANALENYAQGSNLVHFHTDCMREAFLLRKPKWRDKCVTVPFFLPQLNFLPQELITKKFANHRTNILFVGVDGVRKGLFELCSALDELADLLNEYNVNFTVVSKTKHSCKIFKNVKQHFFLSRNEVQKLMQESHVYIMVPHRETFGLVYVEAMAAGCAVIADDDLPRQEIFDNGVCGKLVRSKDSSLLVLEIKKLIQNRTMMLSLALKGWGHAQSRYAAEQVAKQYASIFRQAMT